VCSKADISHTAWNQKLKVGKKKNKNVKTDMLRSIGKQSGESLDSVLKKNKKAKMGRN